MWTLIFVLLIACTGVLSDTEAVTEPSEEGVEPEKCDEDPVDICRPESMPDAPPATAEEFDAACETMRMYTKCMVNLVDDCPKRYDDDKRKKVYVSIANLTEDICTKNTLLYDVISSNAVCIKNSFGYHVYECPAIVEDAMLAHKDYLKEREDDEITEKDYAKAGCVREAADFACFTIHLSANCGQPARAALSETAKRVGILKHCPKNVREDTVEEVEKLKLMEDMKQEIQYVLKFEI